MEQMSVVVLAGGARLEISRILVLALRLVSVLAVQVLLVTLPTLALEMNPVAE